MLKFYNKSYFSDYISFPITLHLHIAIIGIFIILELELFLQPGLFKCFGNAVPNFQPIRWLQNETVVAHHIWHQSGEKLLKAWGSSKQFQLTAIL